MSWVLILNSNWTQKPSAVVGGYLTRAEAECAGDAATAFKNDGPWPEMPFYTTYHVIPGAADSEPEGATTSRLERVDHGEIVRLTERWP